MKKTRILIVEDELIAANYLKVFLQKAGFFVIGIVDSGRDAIDVSREKKPDIILMDIMLRDSISGTEAALAIYHEMPEIIIIFLSAYSDSEMVQYAMDARSYGYLMKPYREQEIINTIKLAMRSKEKKDKLKEFYKVEFGDGLVYDRKMRRLFQNDKEIVLKSKSLALVDLLCQHPNKSISNEQISYHIWGEIKNQATVRTLVYRTRQQIPLDIISSVNSIGYMVNQVLR